MAADPQLTAPSPGSVNRRGFVGNLAAILSAATGPSILALEAFDRFKWKAVDGGRVVVINPEWENAEYENHYILCRELFRQAVSGILKPKIEELLLKGWQTC